MIEADLPGPALRPPGTDALALERATMRRVAWRIIPFLVACYLVAYIDRSNIGFAALTMNADIGLSSSAFGLGGSLFFVAYVLFEVPSNLAQRRFGARRWIARIMLTWGMVGTAMALITGPTGFYVLRFLLGAAEAGFFPGAVLYLTQWFPRPYRARILAWFMISIPLSSFFSSPLSAALLGMDGWAGVAGWQWLFVAESTPAIVLGAMALLILHDRPDQATWLSSEQREWLTATLANEHGHQPSGEPDHSIRQTLAMGPVWALAVIYCGSSATSNALAIWQPQIIKSFGLPTWEIGLLNMIPSGAAAIFMILWGIRADRTGERRLSIAVPLALTAASLLATLFTHSLPVTLALLTLALIGNYAIKGPFWALAAETLPPATQAAGIAAINALAHLGTGGATSLIGLLHDRTGNFAQALLPLGVLTTVSAAMVMKLHSRTD